MFQLVNGINGSGCTAASEIHMQSSKYAVYYTVCGVLVYKHTINNLQQAAATC